MKIRNLGQQLQRTVLAAFGGSKMRDEETPSGQHRDRLSEKQVVRGSGGTRVLRPQDQTRWCLGVLLISLATSEELDVFFSVIAGAPIFLNKLKIRTTSIY